MRQFQDSAFVNGDAQSYLQYADNYCDTLWLYYVLMDPEMMTACQNAENLWGMFSQQYPITPSTLGVDY